MIGQSCNLKLVCSLVLSVAALTAVTAGAADTVDPAVAFERLKSLEGRWAGMLDGTLTHYEYRVSAGGSIVVERLFADLESEMYSVYYLDDGKLVVTHYCAAPNQPRLALDPAGSNRDELRFVYVGGSNLDAAKDGHIHGITVTFVDKDRIDSTLISYNEGKEVNTSTTHLARMANNEPGSSGR